MIYRFAAQIWRWEAQSAAWHFVSLPQDVADELDETAPEPRAGFGSVKVEVTIGGTTWRTSVFPSKEHETFILPVKKAVLKAEGLAAGDAADVVLKAV
ncbi:DUF1905 domain-containing protein [Demequina sp. TTPB684]|uniref:DUF1905 domain-containing protein n=1 Tax=unclassified Demequina TaxID=2620311 RepID=UPI001CF5D601|nr:MULTISPECIES: DUF1905 domain-containing protein [unclassified Demequina]MCB2411598.1 DUF1905 domain-containing protein [Demequina sp. TTPB684]UPU89063.1 DUF1905 domain-containing protein [Demequina sp. TMPB413]